MPTDPERATDDKITFRAEPRRFQEESRYGVYLNGDRIGHVARFAPTHGSRRGHWRASNTPASSGGGGTRQSAADQLLYWHRRASA